MTATKKYPAFMIVHIIALIKSFIFATMIRYTTAILLIFAFAIQTFKGGFVIFDYYSNTAAFAKNCINKAKPKLHCNGKCQMMKKMAEEEKKDQQIPERKFENKIEVLSAKYFTTTVQPGASQMILLTYNNHLCAREVKMPRSFFHPPSALAA
jgi:hypothetical protein